MTLKEILSVMEWRDWALLGLSSSQFLMVIVGAFFGEFLLASLLSGLFVAGLFSFVSYPRIQRRVEWDKEGIDWRSF